MDTSNPNPSEKLEVQKFQNLAKNDLETSGAETGSDRAVGSIVDADEKKVLRKVPIFQFQLPPASDTS